MLKNFWYACAFSTEVTEKPRRVTMLGQELVVYRDPQGRAVVLSDLCVHRGGALSDGWLEGGCIVCPYHGWAYNQEGECVRIPANQPGLSVPRKARVDAYPSEERYGFVWAFLGDLPAEERPPIPPLPEFEDPSLRPMWGEFGWRAHYTRVVENGMDIAHAPFVHAGSFGNPDEPEVEEYEVEMEPWGGHATVTLNPPAPKGLWGRMRGKERPGVKTTAGFYMPNVTRLEIGLPLGRFVLFICHLPVDEQTTISKWLQLRSFFTSGIFDWDARRRVKQIFLEDQPTVESQRPELLPYDLGAELHVRSDALQIAYRRMRREALDRGWGIDRHRILSDYANQRAVVIPSPARRAVPELANAWVMKEVPTRPIEPPAAPAEASAD